MAPPPSYTLNAALFQKIDKRIRRESEILSGAFELFFGLLPFLVRRDMEHPAQFLSDMLSDTDNIEEAFGDYFGFYNAIIHAFMDFEGGKSQHHLRDNLIKLLPQEPSLEECQKRWVPAVMAPVEVFLQEYAIEAETLQALILAVDERFELQSELGERIAYVTFLAQMFYADEEKRKYYEQKMGHGLSGLVADMIETVLELMVDFILLRKLHSTRQGFKVDTLTLGGDDEAAKFEEVGRNDPCPCGSGKKYKKCCMNKMKNPMSTLTTPRILGKKPLTRDEVLEFYRLYDLLMTHVQNDYAMVFGVPALDHVFTVQGNGTYFCELFFPDGKEMQKVRNHLISNPFLIDTLLESGDLEDEEIEVIAQWKNFVFAPMIVMQTTPEGQALVWNPQSQTVYYVYGLHDKISDVVPSLPFYCDILLLGFKGCIIYDGLLGGTQIEYGSTILRSMVEEYAALMQSTSVTMVL